MTTNVTLLNEWADDWIDRIRTRIKSGRIACATILKHEVEPGEGLVYIEFAVGLPFGSRELVHLKSLPKAHAAQLVALLESVPACV